MYSIPNLLFATIRQRIYGRLYFPGQIVRVRIQELFTAGFMKIFVPWTVVALLLGSASARAQESHWLDNYNKAVEMAKTDNKNILLDFTGSDWCPWCIRMDKEVLDTPEFKAYADKNLVLMLVDFPQGKQLSQQVQDQNGDLQKKFGADGFPTFILIDKDGKVLGQQVGYVEGGPSAFIVELESMKK
jgi:thioredoxin-related protein